MYRIFTPRNAEASRQGAAVDVTYELWRTDGTTAGTTLVKDRTVLK
jgi:hypothetical protein